MQFTTANPGGDSTIQRDRWGRPMLVPPGGGKREAYTRVTTVAGTIEDTSNLTKWQLRMVASGLAQRPDLYALAGTLDPNVDKAKLNALCEDAKEASASSAKANWGTALHSILETIDAGEKPSHIPPEIKADVVAYLRLRQRLGFRVVGIEAFVANPTIKVAGTADRLIEINGAVHVADLKSGSVDYGQMKMSAQLAAYAISHRYDTATDEWGEGPVADPNIGYVIHVPHGEGKAAMYPVDLRVGLHVIRTALKARELRKAKPFGGAL